MTRSTHETQQNLSPFVVEIRLFEPLAAEGEMLGIRSLPGPSQDVDEELGTDLLRWVRRARLQNQQGGPLPDRHRVDVAAAELNDALEELFDATRVWMEDRRRE